MQTKYDWTGVPDEVKWIATDRYAGCAFCYHSKPEICIVMEVWKTNNVSDYLNLGISKYQGNWQDSLEERPK